MFLMKWKYQRNFGIQEIKILDFKNFREKFFLPKIKDSKNLGTKF